MSSTKTVADLSALFSLAGERILVTGASGNIGRAIAVRAHCYACTAGQGSSCGGALT